MCIPVLVAAGISAATQVTAGLAIASTAASMYGQHQSAKAQVKATNQQNELQAKEIAQKAGQQISERARMARRERASARAAASEAGVNLGSGSFLAALQTSAMNQYSDAGLISQNEKGQQAARAAQASSVMSQIQVPTALGAALAIGTTGLSALTAGQQATNAGVNAATGSPTLTSSPIDAVYDTLSKPFTAGGN